MGDDYDIEVEDDVFDQDIEEENPDYEYLDKRKGAKNFSSVERRNFWLLNTRQINEVVDVKHKCSSNMPLKFVITNSFVVDPKTDLFSDPNIEKFRIGKQNDSSPSIFLLAKTVVDPGDESPVQHNQKLVIRLVAPNFQSIEVNKKIQEKLCEVMEFQLGLDKIDHFFPEQRSLLREDGEIAGDTVFNNHLPYFDLSTRSYYTDAELITFFNFLNFKLHGKFEYSKVKDINALKGYQSILKFARLTPNKIIYPSSNGLLPREYYIPRTQYGYTPDDVYDPFMYRIWVSTKEICSPLTNILENPEVVEEYGAFRLFTDNAFNHQWMESFGIKVKLTEVYETKYYSHMPSDFSEHYFGKVGRTHLDPKLPALDALFLDVQWDSLKFVSDVPKTEVSMETIHFDMECGNHIQPNGKVRFCIPYVNAKNLEKSVSDKILCDTQKKKLQNSMRTLCPNCPPFWKGHEECRNINCDNTERIETNSYIKKLTKAIKDDEVIKVSYPDIAPKKWIPDPIHDVDEIICICFAVTDIQDMDVTHGCDAYSHYILTHKPKGKPDWKLDLDLLRVSKRLGNSKIILFKNELDMIVGFADLIKSIFPMKIAGYNTNGFDIPYLEDRIKWYKEFGSLDQRSKLGMNPFNIGIMKYFFKPSISNVVVRPNSGRRVITIPRVSIISTLDVIDGVGNETFSQLGGLRSHKLNQVAAANLLYPKSKDPMLKVQLDVTKGRELWLAGGALATNFLAYCLWDSVLSLGLARYFGYDELSNTLAKVTGVNLNTVFNSGVRDKILSLYRSHNQIYSQRYTIPCGKGGAMILMHHPDIWFYSPSRDPGYPDKYDGCDNPYRKHIVCRKTGLVIPNIYEVIERRFEHAWKKGKIRNFIRTEFTPTTPEAIRTYIYSDKYYWSARKDLPLINENDKKCDLNDDELMAEITGEEAAFSVRKKEVDVECEALTKEFKVLKETVDTIAHKLKECVGDSKDTKFRRDEHHRVMGYHYAKFEKAKKRMEKVLNDLKLLNAIATKGTRPQQQHTNANGHRLPQQLFDQSIIGDIKATPKSMAADKKRKAKLFVKKELKEMKTSVLPPKMGAKSKTKPYLGGKVIDMMRAYLEAFVIFSDFNSLYPSIMFSNYIDFSTLLTNYTRTYVYPDISPFKYKKVVLGPYDQTFMCDYLYSPELAKRYGYDTPELGETAWVQDPECLTFLIMDDLLTLRGKAKNEMASHTNKKCQGVFKLFLLSYSGKKMSKLIDRLNDKKFVFKDKEEFGSYKAEFMKTVISKLPKEEIDGSVFSIGPNGSSYVISEKEEDIQIAIILAKNREKVGNSRQNGIKITMNSGYGFMGSSVNLSLPEGAASITAIGRDQIEHVNIIVSNICVVKVMVEMGFGAYLITLGIHPGAFYPELMAKHPEWPPVEPKHLEGKGKVYTSEIPIGGDTDSGFGLVILFSPENMYDLIYPSVIGEDENGKVIAVLDKKAKPLSKFELIDEYGNYRSLVIIQNFLPYDISSSDKAYYANLIIRDQVDDDRAEEILKMHMFVHPSMKKVYKQRMVLEKFADKFLGFGKKRYSFTNCKLQQLYHKGTALVRGDSLAWVKNLMRKEFNLLFQITSDQEREKEIIYFNNQTVEGDEKRIVQMFLSVIKNLEDLAMGKNIIFSDFEFVKKFKRDTSTYGTDLPHIRVARKRINRGETVDLQSRIGYVHYIGYSTIHAEDDDHADGKEFINKYNNMSRKQTDVKALKPKNLKKDQIAKSKQKNTIDRFLINRDQPRQDVPLESQSEGTMVIDFHSLMDGTDWSKLNSYDTLELLDRVEAFSIQNLAMNDGKPQSVSFPTSFKIVTEASLIKENVDTIDYVIEKGYTLNIPYYIKHFLIPSLSLILAPFVSANNEYPRTLNIINKKIEAKVEANQKLYCAEQKRQVETLLWTPRLKKLVDKMNDWNISKISIESGVQVLLVTGRCNCCEEYFTYQNNSNKKEIDQLCQKCKANNDNVIDKVIQKRSFELEKIESKFIECLGACEKCILRTEVALIPDGMVKNGYWDKDDTEGLIEKLFVSDIEDTWKLVSRLPVVKKNIEIFDDDGIKTTKTITISPTNPSDPKKIPILTRANKNIKNNTKDREVIRNSLYPSTVWISSPYDCEFKECPKHVERKLLNLQYEQSSGTLENLLTIKSKMDLQPSS
jgi:DNA polymerase elongation subunit (family B)